MSLPPDHRVSELFVRYWDNALTSDESEELHSLLSESAAARDAFRIFSLQTVSIAELPAIAGIASPVTRRWSRRRVLQYLGGGAVASLMATLVGHTLWSSTDDDSVRISSRRGEVKVRDAAGTFISPDEPVPPGGVVSTIGPTASAILSYSDGTSVLLTGESALSVGDNGRKLSILRGTAIANILPQNTHAVPLILATLDTTISRLSGAVVTVERTSLVTEVGVQIGRVTVSDAAGEPLEIVHGGECLTVQADRSHKKIRTPSTPSQYSLDLRVPLPESWNVGAYVKNEPGPVVRTVRWYDPYHKAEMYQIRSDHRWARGFFKVTRHSNCVVRYRVRTAGPGQVVFCVRTEQVSRSDTGVIEWNGDYELPGPDGWQALRVPIGEMLDNPHTPKFGSPWIGFLFIFNTYKEDLGLEIADFQIVSPEA